LSVNVAVVVFFKYSVAAVLPPRRIESPSVTVICLIAVQKISPTPLAASSAARFMERIALSTKAPAPTERRVLSTFFASAGIRIFIAASLKKPSVRLSFLLVLSVATRSASLSPLTISVLLKPAPVPPDVVLPVFTFVRIVLSLPNALFNLPKMPCAFELYAAKNVNERRTIFLMGSIFFMNRRQSNDQVCLISCI
jgi:hypothetical protein